MSTPVFRVSAERATATTGRAVLIGRILAAPDLPFTEADRPMLEQASLARLMTLLNFRKPDAPDPPNLAERIREARAVAAACRGNGGGRS